jgi:hypothetical protein
LRSGAGPLIGGWDPILRERRDNQERREEDGKCASQHEYLLAKPAV